MGERTLFSLELFLIASFESMKWGGMEYTLGSHNCHMLG